MQKSAKSNTQDEQKSEEQAGPPSGKTEEEGRAQETKSESTAPDLRDQLLRALAETDNVRKRAQRDLEEMSKYAISSFARDLVNVVENLYRALASIPPEAREENEMLKTLAEGVELTLQEMLRVLEHHGVKRLEPLGEKFDHNFHQAVAQVDLPGAPPGTVAQVFQAGYVIHDRLLRPAMVSVAKGEPATAVDTSA